MKCPICLSELSGRSLSQNSYFHLALKIFGDETGLTLDETKCLIKNQLGLSHTIINKKSGEILTVYESSRDWNKEKMAEVIDYLVRTAAEQGIVIPNCEDFKNSI